MHLKPVVLLFGGRYCGNHFNKNDTYQNNHSREFTLFFVLFKKCMISYQFSRILYYKCDAFSMVHFPSQTSMYLPFADGQNWLFIEFPSVAAFNAWQTLHVRVEFIQDRLFYGQKKFFSRIAKR